MAILGRVITVVIAGVLAAPAIAQTVGDVIAKAHQETKAALDPVLPKRIDGMTVLTAVRADDIMLTYEYKIERDKTGLKPEFDDALGKRSIAMVCGNERSRTILQVGGRYGFEYRDSFDAPILSVTVTKDDCVRT